MENKEALQQLINSMTKEDLMKLIMGKMVDDDKKGDEEDEKAWLDKVDWLINPKTGNKANIADNYILYLENSPEYKGKLRYNEFTCHDEFNGQNMTDKDISVLAVKIESDINISTQTKLKSALDYVLINHKYNPVIEYLKGLKWDGEERCEKLFIDNLGAEDNELNRKMTMKWMLAAVKRILVPGCKFDNMLVLQGGQGIGKSTMCERLSKGFCSSLSLSEIGNKDIFQKLNKSWIAIVDELDSFNKKEMSAMKTFFSTSEDKAIRNAYERYAQDYKRHCVFIGTTNDTTFLRDSTSSNERRYWIIECLKTSMDSKVYDLMTPEYVDQLWAEAYHKYQENPNVYLDIEKELQPKFESTMRKFKTYQDDSVIDYVREILDKEYSFEVVDDKVTGQFKDMNDFLQQAKGQTIYGSTNGKINKIPMSALHFVLKDIYMEDRPTKYIVQALSDEWEYKVIYYHDKSYKGLYRKNQITTLESKVDNVLPF